VQNYSNLLERGNKSRKINLESSFENNLTINRGDFFKNKLRKNY
jgi:hypothetical protein